MPGDLHSLYCYLVERGRIKQLDNSMKVWLHIFSRDVFAANQGRGRLLGEYGAPEIRQVIKQRRFFGYREAEIPDAARPR